MCPISVAKYFLHVGSMYELEHVKMRVCTGRLLIVHTVLPLLLSEQRCINPKNTSSFSPTARCLHLHAARSAGGLPGCYVTPGNTAFPPAGSILTSRD